MKPRLPTSLQLSEMSFKVRGCGFESIGMENGELLKCYLQPLTCLFPLISCMMPVFTRQVTETHHGELNSIKLSGLPM